MEKYTEIMNELQDSLRILRENEEKVGKEVLKGPRYKKAYNALLNKVWEKASMLLVINLLMRHEFLKEGSAETQVLKFKENILKVLQEEHAELEKAFKKLLSSYDAYTFLECIDRGPIYVRIHFDIYGEYWLSHIIHNDKGYIEPLHNYIWDEKEEGWRNGSMITGGVSILPPTRALINKEKNNYIRQIEKMKK